MCVFTKIYAKIYILNQSDMMLLILNKTAMVFILIQLLYTMNNEQTA